MEPIPLRTVRPFVIDEVTLIEAAEEEGFDLGDQISISKFLKKRVSSDAYSPFRPRDPCLTGKMALGQRAHRQGKRGMGGEKRASVGEG